MLEVVVETELEVEVEVELILLNSPTNPQLVGLVGRRKKKWRTVVVIRTHKSGISGAGLYITWIPALENTWSHDPQADPHSLLLLLLECSSCVFPTTDLRSSSDSWQVYIYLYICI